MTSALDAARPPPPCGFFSRPKSDRMNCFSTLSETLSGEAPSYRQGGRE
jgi:hypothetical protein